MILNEGVHDTKSLHTTCKDFRTVHGTRHKFKTEVLLAFWDLGPIPHCHVGGTLLGNWGCWVQVSALPFIHFWLLVSFGSWPNTVSVFLFVKGGNIGVLSSSHRVTSCCLSSLFLVYVAKVGEDMRPTPKILRAILYKHILILIQYVNDILDYIHERQFLEMLSLYPFMN